MKNFWTTIITFFVDLFVKSPKPVEVPPAEVATDIINNPVEHTSEEVEVAVSEVETEVEVSVPVVEPTPEVPVAEEADIDVPEIDETPEVIEDDSETTLEDLLEIGGGVPIE